MRTIWKYEVPIQVETVELKMPKGGRIRSVMLQHEQVCMWVEVETSNSPVARRFRIFGTGHPLVAGGKGLYYVGSVLAHDGDLVWHLYEVA